MSRIAPTLRCPCDGRYREQVFTYDAPPEGETRFALEGAYRRAYDRCTLCEHFFGHHDIDLASLYAHDYVDATYGGPSGMRARLEKILALPPEKSDNHARVRRVNDFAREHLGAHAGPWRVLDVGAGLGVFPAGMKAAGWTAMGVEPDERTVMHLREVVGITAWCQDLFLLPVAETGRFEAVTLNKVLEHVEDPVALLARSAEFVADHGFLYIELPDVAAAEAGPGREEFFIEHHHAFSPESFAMTIARAGLQLRRLQRLREPSSKYTLAAFAVPSPRPAA